MTINFTSLADSKQTEPKYMLGEYQGTFPSISPDSRAYTFNSVLSKEKSSYFRHLGVVSVWDPLGSALFSNIVFVVCFSFFFIFLIKKSKNGVLIIK